MPAASIERAAVNLEDLIINRCLTHSREQNKHAGVTAIVARQLDRAGVNPRRDRSFSIS
jgi:hypothetical protein